MQFSCKYKRLKRKEEEEREGRRRGEKEVKNEITGTIALNENDRSMIDHTEGGKWIFWGVYEKRQ